VDESESKKGQNGLRLTSSNRKLRLLSHGTCLRLQHCFVGLTKSLHEIEKEKPRSFQPDHVLLSKCDDENEKKIFFS
jgi:hypothetical protein